MNAPRQAAGATAHCAAGLLLAACAGPLAVIDTSCERLPGKAHCSTHSIETALLPEAEPANADYNRRFLALLAEQKLGEADRANGTGPFGRDVNAITHRDFLAAGGPGLRARNEILRLDDPWPAVRETVEWFRRS